MVVPASCANAGLEPNNSTINTTTEQSLFVLMIPVWHMRGEPCYEL